MRLQDYHRKRDFAITPEPKGGPPPPREGRSFVIQKHAASRLHYDFRLELEGVLKSWAVPKGPSFDPSDKRLAMETEDHPVEYGAFEGVIPEGQYGAGTVLLWDRGTWIPQEDPHKGYRAGKLKFVLKGEKLHGGWTLVKIRGRDARDAGKSWLLIKENDSAARPARDFSVVDERPESVASGRRLEEIAAQRDRVWDSNRAQPAPSGRSRARGSSRGSAAKPPPTGVNSAALARSLPGSRKAPLPAALQPQLATLVTRPPTGDEWLHEMKFDGYRILCQLKDGEARLLSRNGNDWTGRFPSLATAAEKLPVGQALLDGEVAVLLPDGTTSFQALQNALTGKLEGALVYFVFDLLHLDGYDLARVTLEKRKEALKQVTGPVAGPLRYSDHVVGAGEDFFRQACRLSLEGIVSKRRDGAYESGRSRQWLKVKCLLQQEVVLGGFTDPAGSRAGLGALLVGVHDEAGRLQYVGKVGTGFTARVLQDLRRRLNALARKESPFTSAVPGSAKAHWVKPELVAEVAFTEWTGDGRMRHPSFHGLREDKPAREVVREKARPTEAVAPSSASRRQGTSARHAVPSAGRHHKRATRAGARGSLAKPGKAAPPPREPSAAQSKRAPSGGEAQVAGVRLTHPDRILYPGQGTTKRDLALFYEEVADWILPHLKDRPLTLLRCPEGTSKECFFVKHSGVWAPPSLRRVEIQEKTKVGEYLVVDSLPGLIGLVQMGILEIHTWNSVAERIEKPDRLVFDLDPDASVEWERVMEAARLVRLRLEALGLESFLKTTGGKGLHVVAPLRPGVSWDEGFDFSRALAEAIVREAPGSYTTEMPKERRKGKILVDYLRNNRGNTSVAAYSTRARSGAPVSVPLSWDELGPGLRSDQFTVQSLPPRLATLKADPWAPYWTIRQTISTSMKKRLGLP